MCDCSVRRAADGSDRLHQRPQRRRNSRLGLPDVRHSCPLPHCWHFTTAAQLQRRLFDVQEIASDFFQSNVAIVQLRIPYVYYILVLHTF